MFYYIRYNVTLSLYVLLYTIQRNTHKYVCQYTSLIPLITYATHHQRAALPRPYLREQHYPGPRPRWRVWYFASNDGGHGQSSCPNTTLRGVRLVLLSQLRHVSASIAVKLLICHCNILCAYVLYKSTQSFRMSHIMVADHKHILWANKVELDRYI